MHDWRHDWRESTPLELLEEGWTTGMSCIGYLYVKHWVLSPVSNGVLTDCASVKKRRVGCLDRRVQRIHAIASRILVHSLHRTLSFEPCINWCTHGLSIGTYSLRTLSVEPCVLNWNTHKVRYFIFGDHRRRLTHSLPFWYQTLKSADQRHRWQGLVSKRD